MTQPGGLSKSRLARLYEKMAGYVERGEIPGIVSVVCRRGEAHFDVVGTKSIGGGPMQRDTIFRIASMTKPVLAAAAMTLVEEGRLRLDDPVDEFLPELANPRVLRSIESEVDDTVPAHRAITVRDVLTLRLGTGLILAAPGTYPIQQATDEAGLGEGGPIAYGMPAPDEWIRRLGSLPLIHQPGEGWMYHTGADVLAVLIARASGTTVQESLRERIFDPLGMKDTSYWVPSEKVDRLATSYIPNAEGGLDVLDPAEGGVYAQEPAFASEVVSTADDLLAFGQMMLNGGRHGRERILSRLSVQAMTTDQLTEDQRVAGEMILGRNRGWGLCMSVVTRRDGVASVPGRFGWDGGLGTSWSSDPHEEMTGILLTQTCWTSPKGSPVWSDFWTMAYAAIED